MKNIELYRTIEALVQAKKEQSCPSTPSFAHNYCRQQIKKKKLISYNPSSKMNQIMKNFHQLDTYVDVQQLFNYINARIAQKKKQQDIKTHTSIKWKSKQNIVFDDEEIIQRVRQKLGPYNHKIYAKQNQNMKPLIQALEKMSYVGSTRKQNCSSSNDYYFHIQHSKKKQNNQFENKQKWNYYQRNNYILQDPADKDIKPQINKQSQIDKMIIQRPNLKKKQEKRQLIHQVSTYLQIILENQHRKKWDKNTFNANSLIMENNQDPVCQQNQQQKKRPTFRVQRRSTRYTQHKSCSQNLTLSAPKPLQNSGILLKKQNSSTSSPIPKSPIQPSKTLLKKGVKQHFTFRNRNIKQNLMKKINSFLQYVECEQKQFKKQKNTSINQLNNLQNKQKINNNNICIKSFLIDDCQIKQVQSIVQMQK